MNSVTILDRSKRRELKVKRLSLQEFGRALFGFNPYGPYIEVAIRYRELSRSNFQAFWAEIGPLGRSGLIEVTEGR